MQLMKIITALTRRAYYATTHVQHGTRMDPTEHCRNRPHGSVAAQVEVVHKDGASQQAASSVRAEPDRAALKRTADAA